MKILLVQDDRPLSTTLKKRLEANRYTLDLASHSQTGLTLATTVAYDLILVDTQVSHPDGITLCRQLRSQGYRNPILLIMADDSDAVAIAGFDAGADDYIRKPCAPDALLARIRLLLRRNGALVSESPAQPPETTLTWGELCLDLDSGRVTVGGHLITLTATEYKLLELFLRNPDRIFSRSAILDRLWGFDDAPTDRAIVTHVKDVRKKLKAGGLTDDIIETVYGMGYRLKLASPAQSPPENGHASKTSQPGGTPAVNRVLERFRGTFDQRVAVLEQARAALIANHLDPELQQMARREAHKLAGSLASFGYPEGSKLARSIEHLLMSDRPLPPERITQFSELLATLQHELAKTPGVSTALSNSSTSSTPTYQVLVIDDDATLTERLQTESSAWGLHMTIAPNPATARSHLEQSTPDVVLLDLSFSATEEDGLSLLRDMIQQSPDLPVIVFTGRDSLADRLAVSRSGARQFLHKSATTQQIFQAIARVLPRPQASDAKVLIVDDDPAALALLSAMLSPWGVEVVTLSNPEQCWDVLVAMAPDLMLLDLEMPQVSGLELCQVVRQDAQWGDLPILVVTAHTDAASLQHAFAAGADDFIAKPVLGPELVTRVLSRIERTQVKRSGPIVSVTREGPQS